MKYLRSRPETILRAPKHRYVSYVHGLDIEIPSTREEFLSFWEHQRLRTDEEETGRALDWLVKNGLAYVSKI